MLNAETLKELHPYFEQIQSLIDDGDDGTGIAQLVGIRQIGPAYLDTIAQIGTLYDGVLRMAVNPELAYYVYIFAVLHEVFHVVLGHHKLPGFTVNRVHTEFEGKRNTLLGKIIAITEMDASICAGVALFGKDIVERTGLQLLQDIEDATENVRQLDKTLSNLRFRWKITKSSAVMEQIKECEEARQSFEDMLERLQDSLEFQDPPETLDVIAADYGVPVSFLRCNLEGYRRMGYSVIPLQHIDWERIFSFEELKPYMNASSY